jgi:hypothetical protein
MKSVACQLAFLHKCVKRINYKIIRGLERCSSEARSCHGKAEDRLGKQKGELCHAYP